MNTSEVAKNLTEMMMTTDNEKDFATLNEAIKLIEKKEQHNVAVPCSIGARLYSVIGEKVNIYVITGFRIDKEKVYMETEESMFLPADMIGINYFFSPELAEREFDRKWRRKVEKHTT